MNILLIGASGMVGSRILTEAHARGHQITAAARNVERIEKLDGVRAISLDIADLAAQAAGYDVVISALSPRSTADATAEAMGFASALIAAGEKGPRVVMVGGAGSLALPDGRPVLDVLPEAYLNEARGMKAAWGALAASDIDWTVLAPSAEIAPGARSGVYSIGGMTLLADSTGRSHISAEDFAAALIAEVETPRFRRQLVTVGYTA